jgi:V/A-type H+/Na+-transporting ATPase subunit I
MSLDEVSKIEVLCHSLRRERLIAALESFGRAHVIDLPEADESDSIDGLRPLELDTEELSDDISGLAKAINFLQDEATGEIEIKREVPVVRESDLLALIENRELLEDARRAWFVAVQKAKLEGAWKELRQEAAFLEEWKDLPVRFEELRRKGQYRIAAGSMPLEFTEDLRILQESQPLLNVEELSLGRSSRRILITAHNEVYSEVMQALGELGFVQQDFGSRSGSVQESLEEVLREMDMITSRMDALHRRALRLAEKLESFRRLMDAACLLLERMKASNSAMSSDQVYLFRAWIRTSDLESFSHRLEQIGEVDIEVIEPEEGETPPSPLTERPQVAPYRMLTDMYGQPTREDPDPTPLMAPFYALFFGICIGDAGYGIALAAGSMIGWYLVNRRHGNPRLFKLLFQGGIASILVGIFLGGWFGIPFEKLPAVLQAPANLLNALVPGYQPGQPGQEGFAVSKQFLYVTLALGLVQLTAGIVVNLVKRWRTGDKLAALIDQSGWLLATAGLFPWLFNHYLLGGSLYEIGGPLDSIFIYMLAAGALLIFIMGGREARGFGKVGLGAYAMYGIVNLLGDVLSYSRLFALALSSAIIAQVINQMAGMLMNQLGIPVLSLVLAILVVVGGHTFNLAMAALSGFIHTARLQFVEFFGKFYDGTGVPFKPLRYEPRYVHIERDE